MQGALDRPGRAPRAARGGARHGRVRAGTRAATCGSATAGCCWRRRARRSGRCRCWWTGLGALRAGRCGARRGGRACTSAERGSTLGGRARRRRARPPCRCTRALAVRARRGAALLSRAAAGSRTASTALRRGAVADGRRPCWRAAGRASRRPATTCWPATPAGGTPTARRSSLDGGARLAARAGVPALRRARRAAGAAAAHARRGPRVATRRSPPPGADPRALGRDVGGAMLCGMAAASGAT